MENILWNDCSLRPPPVNTYKNAENNFDYQKMRAVVEDMFNVIENQQIFHHEAAIVSRLIYKLGRKFRHDIGYSFLNRTNTALLKYNSLNFLNSVKTFLSVASESDIYLPTRQMFEYLLVRLQTFSKLMTRVVLCSRKGSTYYFDRIKRGDALWLSFMPYIVLSRIWYLARHLLKNACKWYNLLIPFRNELKVVGVPFIPNNYRFPEDLSSWLDLDWLDEKAGQMWQTGVINSFLNINSEASNDNTEDVVNKILKENDTTINNMYLSYSKNEKVLSNDIGETISREIFTKQTTTCTTDLSTNHINEDDITEEIVSKESKINLNNPKKQCNLNKKTNKTNKMKSKSIKKLIDTSNHSLDKVNNIKSLKMFLKKEEHYRNDGDKLSLTSNLGFIQWQSLKNVLTKLDDSNILKFNQKLNKIWSSKV